MNVRFDWRFPKIGFVLVLVISLLMLAGVGVVFRLNTSRIVVKSQPHPDVYFFPDGGRILFPHYRLIALYGVPDTPVLGALGAQPLDKTLARVKALAHTYQPLMREHTLPTLEIIATIASAYPEPDGSYSYQTNVPLIKTWVKAARANDVYVVLDLQPGRTDFLTQAKRLQSVLAEPNVGLALDPEWRLTSTQVPLEQIGSVSINEVNNTLGWLADMTKSRHLPQKLFLLHQFRVDMLPARQKLDTSRTELAYAIQMDGQGSQDAKLSTWNAILAHAPTNVHFGWKNFYKKATPVRTPAKTMSLEPKPWYVSYQ